MSKSLAVGSRRWAVAGALVVALLGAGAVAVSAASEQAVSAVKPAVVHPIPKESLKPEPLTSTQKKTERARFLVYVPIVKGNSVLNVAAWVGDPANGGVKAKVTKLSNSGTNLRYRVQVPLAKSAVVKRGMTFTYRVKFPDGTSEWRTRGAAIS